MGRRVPAIFAVLLAAGSHELGAAEREASVPLSSLSHIHGIAFGSADDLILATHHGVFAVDPAGQARLISAQSGPQGVPVTAIESTGSGEIYAFFAGGGLFRREGDGLWTAISADFGQRVILHLAVDGDTPDRLAAVTDASAVLISEDAGKSWRAFAQ